MNRILLTLMLVVLLGAASCAAPFDDAQGKPTPTATITPTLSPVLSPTPTETPPPLTATPVPTYSIEQLTAMSPADKLAMAPQVGTAPADVVASFLPKGADVADVTWGEKSLTYWERVVSYHGKAGGQEVTLYYDLESGQWAKKYESFESLSQIPASQIPDVMVLGDRLIHVNPPYEDGKKIFRDEQNNPQAVFDTVNQKWLALEQIDLKSNYEQKVSVEYMGVQIDASLITDESLDPVIKKVTVGETAYAEFVARSIYKVWLRKGGPDGTGPKAETTFEQFMALWSTAQQSGSEADWRQVQVKNIWANDIPTPGYEQHPYTIWFMHEGQTPEDVKGISNLSIALVKTHKMKNITAFNNNEYDEGMGLNFEGKNMHFYLGLINVHYSSGLTASGLPTFYWWLIRNSGGSVSGYPTQGDDSLKSILVKGGLTQ